MIGWVNKIGMFALLLTYKILGWYHTGTSTTDLKVKYPHLKIKYEILNL